MFRKPLVNVIQTSVELVAGGEEDNNYISVFSQPSRKPKSCNLTPLITTKYLACVVAVQYFSPQS